MSYFILTQLVWSSDPFMSRRKKTTEEEGEEEAHQVQNPRIPIDPRPDPTSESMDSCGSQAGSG